MATAEEQPAAAEPELLSVEEYRQRHSITVRIIGQAEPPAGSATHEPDGSATGGDDEDADADDTACW